MDTFQNNPTPSPHLPSERLGSPFKPNILPTSSGKKSVGKGKTLIFLY
jgi:hypothetical protein